MSDLQILKESIGQHLYTGLELAINRAWVKYGKYKGKQAWCIKDVHCAQWRLLTCNQWWKNGPEALFETGSRCDNGIGWSDAIDREIVFITFNPYDAFMVLAHGITIPEENNLPNVIDKIGTIVMPSTNRMGPRALDACKGKFVVICEDYYEDLSNLIADNLADNQCKVCRMRGLEEDQNFIALLARYENWANKQDTKTIINKENEQMPKMIMVTDMLQKKHTAHKNEAVTYSWHGGGGKRASFVLTIPNEMVEKAKRSIRSTAQIGVIENSSSANILIGNGYPFNLIKASSKRVSIKWGESGVEFMEKFFPRANNVELKVKQISEGCITIELPMKMVHDYLNK